MQIETLTIEALGIQCRDADLTCSGVYGASLHSMGLPDAMRTVIAAALMTGAVPATLLAIHVGFTAMVVVALMLYGIAAAARP